MFRKARGALGYMNDKCNMMNDKRQKCNTNALPSRKFKKKLTRLIPHIQFQPKIAGKLGATIIPQ